MSKRTEEPEKASDKVFEFAAFLAAAARGSIEEGGLGASLRFLDALSRLPSLFSGTNQSDEFLEKMKIFITENMTKDFLNSPRDEYVRLLDQVQVQFAREIRRRNGLTN